MPVDEFVVAQFGSEEEPQRTSSTGVFPRGRAVLERVLPRRSRSGHGQRADVARRLADAGQLVVGQQVRLQSSRRVEYRLAAAQQAAMDVAVLQHVRGDVDAHLLLASERLLTLDALERLRVRRRRGDVELRQSVATLAGQADVVDRVAGGAQRSQESVSGRTHPAGRLLLLMLLLLLVLVVIAVMMTRVQRQFQRRHERLPTHDARDGRRRHGCAAGTRARRGYGRRGDGGGVMLLTVSVKFIFRLHRFAAHHAHVTMHHLQQPTKSKGMQRLFVNHHLRSAQVYGTCSQGI